MEADDVIAALERVIDFWEAQESQNEFVRESIKAVKKANKVLEKQIPQFPEKHGIRYYCPRCTKYVCSDNDEKKWYCPDCGQRLDWRRRE